MIKKQKSKHGKTGQVIIFLLIVLVALFFVVISNLDLNKILHVKSLTRHAGDSSALMGARWQGISLNLIGNLNVMKAMALSFGYTNTIESITEVQARLCFTGPMTGFLGAQQAAKHNHIYSNPAYTERIHQHAEIVRNIYPFQTSPDGQPLFPEPYEGCWNDYANMLDIIASDGIAAGPDNARFYNDYPESWHPLLMPDFYEAIRGRIWCWFFINSPNLLEDYDNYTWWPPLPDIANQQCINSEIFGLGLSKIETSLVNFSSKSQQAGTTIEILPISQTNIMVSWYCYNPDVWSTWDAINSSDDSPEPYLSDSFPINGQPKQCYDYAGADTAIRIQADITRLTPGPKGSDVVNAITWTAAAKPFGYLQETNRPNDFSIVLPAFHDAALIPLDASSAPASGAFDLEWREHIELHLPIYAQQGPNAPIMNNTCWYCAQLGFDYWENPSFRNAGSSWLNANSWKCTIPPSGGGGGSGGGTRRGH